MEIPTMLAAMFAGLVSFLSPCVLPVVPAYLGQLGVVAVSGPFSGTPERRGWRVLPNAAAFVLGFGTIFTVMGAFVYVAAGPLRDNLPLLRTVGGIVLIVLGLNLMGIIRLSRFWRSWKPLETFDGSGQPRRRGVVGGFTLGAIFAVGWTPCIGPTLGAILGLAALGTSPDVIKLLVAYSLGLGVPFMAMAVAVDRAPGIVRPLIRHGRSIEIVGGALVVIIGLAILFDWLAVLYRWFSFLVPSV